jgi:hypothetical protein
MYAYEIFLEMNNRCVKDNGEKTYNAFYWVFADANTKALHNTTLAAPIME